MKIECLFFTICLFNQEEAATSLRGKTKCKHSSYLTLATAPLVGCSMTELLSYRINHIHERALCFAYKDYQTDFESLLELRNLVSIHVKNLQLLMTEIYKTKYGLSPPFIKDIFAERNTGYNLSHGNDSQLPTVHTTTYGIETISFLGNRL